LMSGGKRKRRQESARIVAAAEKVNIEPAVAYRDFVDAAEKARIRDGAVAAAIM